MRRMRHLKPREIQGCQLALDASIATSLYDATSGGSLVAADGAVARWEDQSGSGYHVTQATGTKQPLRRVANRAGLDALQFDNTDDRLINASIGTTRPHTIFAVGQTSNDLAVAVDNHDNFQNALGRGGATDNPGKFFASNGASALIDNDTVWGCLLATYTSAEGKTLQRGRTFGSTATNAGYGFSGISVGDIRGNPTPILTNYRWGGYLSEICVFNTALNRSVAQRLIDSRSRKWRTDR